MSSDLYILFTTIQIFNVIVIKNLTKNRTYNLATASGTITVNKQQEIKANKQGKFLIHIENDEILLFILIFI